MDRISKLAGLFLSAGIVGICLASGCGKDEGGKTDPPSPPDPPQPTETVIETFKKTTVPGAYDLSGNALKAIISYVEGENQYSFYKNGTNIWCGVADMEKGMAFKAGVPEEMVVDNNYSVSMMAVGANVLSPVNGKKLTCVKTAVALYWVVDAESGIGLILARKEL